MDYILAFDQGTTSSRSIIFDRDGEIVATAQKELRQIFPKSGWVEHDPDQIFTSQIDTAIEALKVANINPSQLSAVGITNQRETAVVWNRKTGRPIHNAIVWQDRRTSEFCDRVRADYGELIREKTGLEVDAYFSASKIRWLLDNVTDVISMAENGELAFGTVDAWLIWKLTKGGSHLTDVSNASRTMLFNIDTLGWDNELLDIFGIPHMLLPEIRPSSGELARVEWPNELKGINIAGNAGDQQAALFGQACFAPSETKSTYGTGCFLLQNTGTNPVRSKNRLLTTVGWKVANETIYALEGSVFIGGAVIQWLRDGLGILERSKDVEVLAGSVEDSGGVFFVPAFTGLGTPYWDQGARGTIVGITRGTGKAHIARAAQESIAFQTADLLTAMNADSHSTLQELRVDGGATANDSLMQFQADILQIPVVRSKIMETTALGAAYLAGLGTGFWSSQMELSEHWKPDRTFYPKMAAAQAEHLISRWHDAVERSLNWEK